MTKLFDEMARRFPEIAGGMQGDAELPYLLMSHLVEWLRGMPSAPYAPELVNRIVRFWKWCEEQPRGKTAEDDLPTVLIVGFYENLFQSNNTQTLIPRLVAREDFVANADYLKTWVGEERYSQALALYDPLGKNA